MTSLLAICFSALAGLPLLAATVSGSVQLQDSSDATVRKSLDYSGVVISLTPVETLSAARPESQQTATRKVVMIQKKKTFSPHIVAISVGDSVEFPNADPIFHNAFSNYSGQIFDIGLYAPGTTRTVRFTRPGVVRIFCNIHSAMSAVIVVSGAPYFTVTKRDGSFAIPHVAAGAYLMEAFHERATEATLRSLSRQITVEHGDITLPRLQISEAGYLPMPHKNKYGHEYPPEAEDRRVYPAAKE